MRIILYFTLLVAIAAGCSSDKGSLSLVSENNISSNRPHDPWIFRSVLDNRPRNITLALSDDIWAAYNTQNGSLYKIWGGTVDFDGAVYNHAHGPQPMSVGNAYFVNEFDTPWYFTNKAGDITDAIVQYRGHKIVDNHAILMYELSGVGLPNKVSVKEQVEATTTETGQPIFTRLFTTSDVPDGYTIHLKTNANSIIIDQNIKTDGVFAVIEKKEEVFGNSKTALNLTGDLSLKSNGLTSFEITLLNTPLINNPNAKEEQVDEESGSSLPAGLLLIAKSDCKTCHNKNVKTIGPSYMAIANKYENNAANITMLANKIKMGGTGIWGNQIMTPHPNDSEADLKEMVSYILSLNKDKVEEKKSPTSLAKKYEGAEMKDAVFIPGLMTQVYEVKNKGKMPETKGMKPKYAGVMKSLDNITNSDFIGLEDNFKLQAEGYLFVEIEGEYIIESWSDDGSLVYLGDELIVDNDGNHGTELKIGTVDLTKGYHPIKIEHYNGTGGKFLSLNWIKPGDKFAEVIPPSNLLHIKDQEGDMTGYKLPMSIMTKIPGNKQPVSGVHPSFTLTQARPDDFTPKVGGLDFMKDGSMIVCVWDAKGSVYKIENAQSGDPSRMKATQIGFGLAEPLGLKIVDERIFVMQKQEMTELIDNDNDGMIDEYRVLSNDWKVSANFHEFGFGLAYKEGNLYATLATGIQPGGASVVDQIPDRGKVIRVNITTGKTDFLASGLRTPNGIGVGYGGGIYVADNQGDWLPASKIVHVTDGAWFGSRSVDFEGTAKLKEKPPVVWLPQDEIGNSPSTPLSIDLGPYKGQMIHGEVTHGGVKRVFVEEVNGQYQGGVFRFIQGLEAGINRMVWGPDNALYVGGIGNPGNWSHAGGKWFGLQRLAYNNESTFEMLAVRAKSNGVEIEFTEPLKNGDGWNPNDYEVKQWYYKPTKDYGGPKLDEKSLKVKGVTVSDDRKKVFLELEGMKAGQIVYINLLGGFISDINHTLWSTECWYTMNQIPKGNNGTTKKAPYPFVNNTLSGIEKSEGWELLFDGKKIDQFRNFKKKTLGKSWTIDQEAIHLNAIKEDGKWQAKDGGDIITLNEYEDYEFKVDWKITNCGNSGIIFNVVEDDKYDYVWQTGPEMQVLDDVCHPDTRFPTHNAGDLYDMIACNFATVKPAGEWNTAIIRSKGGMVNFYLNGYNVVNFEMHTNKWKELIAGSKFKDMPGFGLAKKGHIALQDHGDKVWYRNIKVRKI